SSLVLLVRKIAWSLAVSEGPDTIRPKNTLQKKNTVPSLPSSTIVSVLADSRVEPENDILTIRPALF
ncbi:MAG: hypothetical protein II397_10495, partial [Treponema sp.]|nr:hypothetical protein [Treponema sp.]